MRPSRPTIAVTTPATITSIPATTTTLPTVTFTPTSRYVGLTFVSFEGEVPNTNGLRLLDTGCLDVATGHCDGAWVIADDQGPMLWVATQAPGSLVQTVHNVFTISGVGPAEALHFAQGRGDDPLHPPSNGSILALVRGSSDSTFHWTDIVAAWMITTMTTSRSTTGLAVFDACASYRADRNQKAPRQCPTGT